MKKVFIVLFLFLFCFSFSYANLIDIYKKGKIKLVPDPNFGKNTNWDEMFYKGIRSIAFASDGSFFVTALGGISHSVYKFDKNGNFIKKFGRKGRGPGDFYHPGDLSILDNKYLVIGEYATARRISVFDLRGKFIRKIKTSCSVYDVLGLGNNKIIIKSKSFLTNSGRNITHINVFIKDLKKGKEKKVFKTSYQSNFIPLLKYEPDVYINKTKDSNLIVADSGTGNINLLSKKGKEILKFHINIRKRKIDSEMKELYFKKIRIKTSGKHFDFRKMIKFNKYLPPFEKIVVDSMGNILVFYNNGFEKAKELRFKVYSPKGKYLCDSFFIVGKFKYDLYKWDIKFFKESIFFTGIEDEKNKIFKINLGKTSLATINKK